MARRNGRPGKYLAVDDNSGFTVYANQLQTDYWRNETRFPLKRNLQEISSPLGDPYPVSLYRGPQYEQTNACMFETSPIYIGKTTKPFPQSSAYAQFQNLEPGVGAFSVGCTLKVH